MGLPADPGGSFIMVTSYWEPDLEGQGMFESLAPSVVSSHLAALPRVKKGATSTPMEPGYLQPLTPLEGPDRCLGTCAVGWKRPV